MSRLRLATSSVRAHRLRALTPRLLVYATLAMLSIAGIRAIAAGTPAAVVQAAPSAGPQADVGVASFAESFARAYLTWDAADPGARTDALTPYLGEADADAGLTPAEGTAQTVAWTTVAAIEEIGQRTLVTVAAQTSAGMTYLAVPVARSAEGVLRIAGYPAFVGPPAIDLEAALEAGTGEQEVETEALTVVVERALRNYLGRSDEDLLADLAPEAIVSLPDRALRLTAVERVTWAVPRRRVAVQLQARDRDGTELTLRYELDVRLSDRWYVRGIHVDPTGGPR